MHYSDWREYSAAPCNGKKSLDSCEPIMASETFTET